MTSRNLIRAASLLALLLTFSVAADAQRGRWQSLGTAYVDGARDRDMIRVNARGAFTALQLGIKGGEIEFQRVVVHFENGGQQELEVRDRIPAGGKTRIIDLSGERRRIESVEFWYSKPTWRTRPRVQAWGRR
ncbi:MAG: hypothetical protein ACJ74J_21555 [Blastocatellia bacterium]